MEHGPRGTKSVPKPFLGTVLIEQPGYGERCAIVALDQNGLRVDHVDVVSTGAFSGGAFGQIRETGKFRVLLVAKAVARSDVLTCWRFIVNDITTARELLEAAGIDPAQPLCAHLERPLAPEERIAFLFPIALPMLVGLLLLPTNMGFRLLVFSAVGCALFVLYAALATRANVVVGTDGVLWRRWLRRRFAPFSIVRAVTRDASGLLLWPKLGTPMVLNDLRLPKDPTKKNEQDFFADLLMMRIEGEIVRHELLGLPDPTAQGKRRDMPISEWIAELRAAPPPKQDYRSAPSREPDHDAILDDGSIDIVTRACAAVALRARKGESAIPRLRGAAAATASPTLREALQKIADGEPDDEIAKTIEKLR